MIANDTTKVEVNVSNYRPPFRLQQWQNHKNMKQCNWLIYYKTIYENNYDWHEPSTTTELLAPDLWQAHRYKAEKKKHLTQKQNKKNKKPTPKMRQLYSWHPNKKIQSTKITRSYW